MPTRNGQPTAEEIVAAQRSGEGPPPPPPPGQGLGGEAAAAAALAATAAAAGAASSAPAWLAGEVSVQAIQTAAAGIIGAFDRFITDRRLDQEDYVTGLLEAEIPDLPEDARLEVVDSELEAERAFAAKARARLDRDLPKALMIADRTLREAEVRKILDRERRYVEMREEAVAVRALGAAEKRVVKQRSPEGAYWRLSPHVREHTLDCLAMGGKVWPWSILETYHPPLHVGCACELLTIEQAVAEGLAGPADFATGEQAIHAMSIAEAYVEEDDLDEEMALLEAAWERRWGKGTTKAGQFRPRRGGDPGRFLRRRRGMRLPRMETPTSAAAVEKVVALGDELDIRDLTVADLREGDRIMAGGELDRVVNVRSPGLLDLERRGLVYIDRETVRGIPVEPRPDRGGRHGLPELPEPGADDRYEVRFGDNASLVMWDREADKPYAVWDDGWDLDEVKRILDEHNADHRARLQAAEPEPPQGTGGATLDDVLKLARMRRPAEGGELLPGFHFDPDLPRSEARDGDLHLPPGFFKQSRAIREKVLIRHLGARLADGLGPDGLKALGDQDDSLRSRRAIIDTFYGLNSDARERLVDVRPDAARLVATAAVERDIPLHPDAAKLARTPAAADAAAADHPAHGLARRLNGLAGVEARDMLGAAGYQFGGGGAEGEDTFAFVFHNHDAGASITLVQSAVNTVTDVRVDVPPPVDPVERDALVGLDTAQAIERMKADGFAPNYTSAGAWLRFVHPDGRGRALRYVDTGPKLEVRDVAAFQPTGDETQKAGALVVQTDPLRHVKPGDDFDTIAKTLEGGYAWRRVDWGSRDDLGDGATNFVAFKRGDGVDDHIVVHVRHEGDRNVVVRAGLAAPGDQTGRIVTAAEREQLIRQHAEEVRRAAEEAERAADIDADALREAVQAGDANALKKVLGNRGPGGAVRYLRQHGFELRGRRRSRKGGESKVTYTLRGPNGVTVKVAGPLTFGADSLEKVEIVGNPQGGRRDRLPAGQAPRNIDELLVDALGRADELGARYNAGVHVTAFVEGGVQRGAAAHHEWNGTVAIRKSGEGKRIRSYLKRRAAGESLSERDHLDFYNDVETLQHEINHGVAKPGDEDGGLSFGQRHYRGLGKNIEEALTEETAHVLAAEWLRSHGLTDVLAAVKRNPHDHRVLGVYRDYRVQLRRILDDADVPQSERRGLLERMKFQMTPEERQAELLRLSGDGTLSEALHGHARRRSDMQRNFEPVLRPDLDDIDATPQATTSEGRVLSVGAAVMVVSDGRSIAGEVVAIRDGYVKVRTEDGLELWYEIRRVH